MSGSSKRTSDSAGKQKRKPGSIDLNTARQMLPLVRSIVTDLVDTKAKLQTLAKEQGVLERERRHLTWESRQRRYALSDELVQTESQYSSVLNELNQLGVAVVDPVVGMVDFPTRINGRPAAFSWQQGEETLNFWRYTEEDQRRPIPNDWQSGTALKGRAGS